MDNPLAGASTGSGGGDIPPGSTRTILAKDRQGNILKTMTLYRTERDYVFDLCDCYNAHRTGDAKERGVEWFVAPNGELRIGTADDWSRQNRRRVEGRNETERARHNRLTLEAARSENTRQPEDP